VLFRFPCEGKAHRLTALHQQRFWARGACFRDRTSATRASIRLAFARLHPVLVQPLRAEPRSWPGRLTQPPGRVGAKPHRAGAASCSAFKTPLESAPREQDSARISAHRAAGIRIPITKCFSCRAQRIKKSGGRSLRFYVVMLLPVLIPTVPPRARAGCRPARFLTRDGCAAPQARVRRARLHPAAVRTR